MIESFLSNEVSSFTMIFLSICTAYVTYITTKSTNTKDIKINERQQLSDDEKAFRSDLKEMVSTYKEELDQALTEIKTLRKDIATLTELNLELTLQNKMLESKVDDLMTELNKE